MERVYFSTFITGFQSVIGKAIESTLKDTKIKLLLDSLIVYTTSSSIDTVKNLPSFNNTFLLIKQFNSLSKDPLREMSELISKSQNLIPMIKS